jgi:hypothetical protein
MIRTWPEKPWRTGTRKDPYIAPMMGSLLGIYSEAESADLIEYICHWCPEFVGVVNILYQTVVARENYRGSEICVLDPLRGYETSFKTLIDAPCAGDWTPRTRLSRNQPTRGHRMVID